jgi:hypothetical protein
VPARLCSFSRRPALGLARDYPARPSSGQVDRSVCHLDTGPGTDVGRTVHDTLSLPSARASAQRSISAFALADTEAARNPLFRMAGLCSTTDPSEAEDVPRNHRVFRRLLGPDRSRDGADTARRIGAAIRIKSDGQVERGKVQTRLAEFESNGQLVMRRRRSRSGHGRA